MDFGDQEKRDFMDLFYSKKITLSNNLNADELAGNSISYQLVLEIAGTFTLLQHIAKCCEMMDISNYFKMMIRELVKISKFQIIDKNCKEYFVLWQSVSCMHDIWESEVLGYKIDINLLTERVIEEFKLLKK